MATLPRLPKSGNQWYNIKITFQQDAHTFFDANPLLPPVHQEILMAPTADDATDEPSYTLLSYLDPEMMPIKPQESTVASFAPSDTHTILEPSALARSCNS